MLVEEYTKTCWGVHYIFTEVPRREILRTSDFAISANFALTEFCEVRLIHILRSSA
jgi:hypothetical protein